ncbi:MAG: hypothetical protein JNM94_01810 [Phycisphaerae bacterium]|nr:hypothetical protein [Phycisphaerae bacterium]
MLADPWSRAAHCMVQGWRIRLSLPIGPKRRHPQPRPTWEAFARLAVGIASRTAGRASSTAWHRWATARVTPTRRYVPKAKQARTGHRSPSAECFACSIDSSSVAR